MTHARMQPQAAALAHAESLAWYDGGDVPRRASSDGTCAPARHGAAASTFVAVGALGTELLRDQRGAA